MKRIASCVFYVLLLVSVIRHSDADSNEDTVVEEDPDELTDVNTVLIDEAKVEYAKGSVCGYCSFCKFCQLCDTDCPCERSQSKPNCHMCKYCTYCHLCSALCDTVCTPGGILDRVSGAIVNSLPSFNKDEVEEDIDSVRHWIEKKKDEL